GLSSLKRMRKFYYIIQKGALLAHQINWSNYVEILPINSIDAINYYIDICIGGTWLIPVLRIKLSEVTT
ncbi:MAG: hypothetical protein IKZ39_01360, partial [Lachnospiraceae bacterium]|nr:hypothetical protein [Lachnospiraceae bacterium]